MGPFALVFHPLIVFLAYRLLHHAMHVSLYIFAYSGDLELVVGDFWAIVVPSHMFLGHIEAVHGLALRYKNIV